MPYPTSLPSSTPATHQVVNDEIVAIADEIGLRFRRRNRFGGQPSGDGIGYGFSSYGLTGSAATGTGSGSYLEYILTSAATAGSAAVYSLGGFSPITHARLSEAYGYGKISATTGIRFFTGINHAMADSDDPQNGGTLTRYYAGVQYSTPRADANWQFVCNAAGTQVRVNSGIAVDTNYHWFGVRFLADGTVRISVDDTSADLAFAQATAQSLTGWHFGAWTQEAVAKAVTLRGMAGSALAVA